MQQDSDSVITLGVVSEIHYTQSGEPNVSWHNELRFDLGLSLLESALTAMLAENVDAIAVLGDVTNRGDRESMQRVQRQLQDSDKPVIVLSGNHDITAADRSAPDFQQFFTNDTTCAPPLTTKFGGFAAQLLGLTRSPETNLLTSLGDPLPSTSEAVIVMSHYPLLPMTEALRFADLKHAGDISDLEIRSRQLADRHGPTLVMHGHLHVRATTTAGSVLHLSFAALVEPPHEVSIVTISETSGEFAVGRRAISVLPAAVERLPVLSPDREHWAWNGAAWHASTV